jgi:hypothetical protein
MIYHISDYLQNLANPQYRQSAVKVALLVGTVLFLLNHGNALLQGTMNQQRWISGLLTYFVPYCVNVHGQWSKSSSER